MHLATPLTRPGAIRNGIKTDRSMSDITILLEKKCWNIVTKNVMDHIDWYQKYIIHTFASKITTSTRATPWCSLESWTLATRLNSARTVVKLFFRSITWLIPCLGPTNSVVADCFSSFPMTKTKMKKWVFPACHHICASKMQSLEDVLIFRWEVLEILYVKLMLPGQRCETRSLQMVEGHSRHAYTVTFLVKEKPAKKQMDDKNETGELYWWI